ncbi:MAG: hypothetical protein EA381_19740 [Planctomycetaceae bacterium]|nr:MAG: hypothetical protein EA381_19740 [Planctomycetaceae bacterium]
MNGVLRDWVRGFQTDTVELIGWKQKLEVAKAEQRNDQVQEIEQNIRDTNARLHDNYQAILQSLRPQMEAKARQSGFVGENRNLFDDVLSKCLLRVNPDSESLSAYILKACANEIVDEFRRRNACIPLPAGTTSGDADDEAESPPKGRPQSNEPVTEADAPPTGEKQLKVDDPEAYRRQQVALLVAKYALRKRILIYGLKFSSVAQLANLLADQRQRTAKLLAQSGYTRDAIPKQTEWRERWSGKDGQRRIEGGTQKQPVEECPTLAEVWKALSERIRNSQRDIGQRMVVDAIDDCGGTVSHVLWRQWRRRYMKELKRQLDPHDLKYFP